LQKDKHFDSSIEYYDRGLAMAKGSELKFALGFNRSVAYGQLGGWDKVFFSVAAAATAALDSATA